MKGNKKNKPAAEAKKTENINDLKKQTVSDKEVKKGYNENNPVQPQGAFKPDKESKSN